MTERRQTERRQNPAPSYPWYVRDYAEDEAVKLMTYEEEGIYRRLLDHQWFHGGLPGDVTHVAQLVPKVSLLRFKKVIWPKMAAKFENINGRLVNPKLERVRVDRQEYRDAKSKAGTAGALVRWDGRRVAER